jgi:hypothetical protein
MFDQFLSKADELLTDGQSFAIAVVVRYQAPISGKPGNKAIIFPDGKIWGWVGGGCAQPVVVKEALKALADGQPRLIRISPSSSPEEGIVDYSMTCHSGGTLDIYIEPVLPKPHILILGRSPVAKTLARLGKAIGYAISVVAPGADRESFPDSDLVQAELDLGQLKTTPQTFIVVSTQGEGDEEALEGNGTLLRDLSEEILDALLSPAVELEELLFHDRIQVEVEHVGRRTQEAGLDELRDLLLADPVDLEGAAPRQDQRPTDELRQALRIPARPVLAFLEGIRVARRTAFGHLELLAPAPENARTSGLLLVEQLGRDLIAALAQAGSELVRITVDRNETQWRYVPNEPWKPGDYNLVVDTSLEDLAGNRIGRPFDIDTFEPVSQRVIRKTVSLPFRVGQNQR